MLLITFFVTDAVVVIVVVILRFWLFVATKRLYKRVCPSMTLLHFGLLGATYGHESSLVA